MAVAGEDYSENIGVKRDSGLPLSRDIEVPPRVLLFYLLIHYILFRKSDIYNVEEMVSR
ncbi:MAG: hypothetical protein JXA18_06395 [Chitinispirillaceae bacterium]|nr:hypothetical protein [Chitinispirillaceae bacterium]